MYPKAVATHVCKINERTQKKVFDTNKQIIPRNICDISGIKVNIVRNCEIDTL